MSHATDGPKWKIDRKKINNTLLIEKEDTNSMHQTRYDCVSVAFSIGEDSTHCAL